MLPLGDLWSGNCHSAAPLPSTPVDNPALLQTCNLGYARATCPHFPAAAPADAFRFTISRDDGGTFSIRYVTECDHHPLAHRSLDYSRALARLLDPPADPILRRQATAYAESYLHRTQEAHATR